ncbi:MAG: hypothetical protein IKT08_04735 [Bacteroidales bacterium]|nr:hypothetical protein [Bacteroidales bacterium]
MKTLNIFICLMLGALCFSSCEKTKDNTWQRFYGFSKEDIVGHYEANPDTTCYSELPTEGVVVYPNTIIDITSMDGDLVKFHIVIPNTINKYFTGLAVINESDSEISFHNNNEDVHMTVYKNQQNQVRLHGRERRCRYDAEGEIIDCIIHGFDVIQVQE